MAILTILINVLVMENMSKIHFSKCKCHGGYDGDSHDFCQSSGHEIHFSKCKCPGGYNGDPQDFNQCSGHEEHV